MRSLFQVIALLTVIFLFITGVSFFYYSDGISLSKAFVGKPHPAPSAVSVPTLPEVVPIKGNATLFEKVPPYIHAIMDPTDTTFPRLECPEPNADRYVYLRGSSESSIHSESPKYFFALDLHQRIDLVPRLIGSIVDTIRFLGSQNCVLSIVEGRSDDGTYEVLQKLRSSMQLLGVNYIFQTSDIDPMAPGTDRIKALAELRNTALDDLVRHPKKYHEETTVIFSNDVALCMEDLLELIHQRVFQGADQTCAMDWTYVGEGPTFNDVGVARGMTGDTFFNIPPDGSLESAWNLLWDDPKAHSRLLQSKPFQVFACWNGIAAFTAQPLMQKKVAFRAHKDGECIQGESKLFAKDMWFHGYGKIAVVPSVNVGYSDDAAKKIKELKGYASKHVANGGEDIKIEWEAKPPAKVKCMPDYEHQTFVDWDEGLRI